MKYVGIVFVILLINLNLIAQTAIAPSSGNGTQTDPYQISSLGNLYWIAASDAVVPSPNRATRWSRHYIQTADIDASATSGWFSGEGWIPIGFNSSSYFSGVYDGRGHTISGLCYDRNSTNNGLFGYTNGAKIENLGVINVSITSGTGSTAALVGNATSSTLIHNCYSTGSVSGGTPVGGLVGTNYGSSVVSNCFSTCTVTSTGSAGGLVGNNVQLANINYSYSKGSVSGSGSVGGLLGYQSLQATTNNSYWNTQTSGQTTSAGGEGRTTTQMTYPYATNTYVGWDFTRTWIADVSGSINNGYPYLLWQYFPMSGTYIINHDGTGNFQSFNTAVSHLLFHGIDAPVVFEVRPGFYTEQVFINCAIWGSSSQNTITFRGSANNWREAILQYSPQVSTDRYVLRLNGASHLRFHNLSFETIETATYGWTFHIMTGCQDIQITDCSIVTDQTSAETSYIPLVISGSTTNHETGASGVSDILIQDNNILGGFAGISYRGESAADNIGYLQILNNEILSPYYHGIYSYYASSPIIKYNQVSIRSSGIATTEGSGLYFNYIYGGMDVSYNKIINPGQYGISAINSTASSAYPNLLYNNFIGGGFRNTGAYASGIYLDNGTSYFNIYYNSINVDNGSGAAIYATAGLTNLRALNNSFAYDGPLNGRAAYYTSTTSILEHDHNNYYTGESSEFIFYGTAIYDLAPLQSNGHDQHSHIGDPMYVSATDLHVQEQSTQLQENGIPVPGISDDIDLQYRNPINPCIGADEFGYAMSGTYVIDHEGSGDYDSFTAAVEDLYLRGVEGPVTFIVYPGIYYEQLMFEGDLNGVSDLNTITFTGIEGTRQEAILRFEPTISEERHVIRMTGAKHLRFNDLRIEAIDSATYGWAFHIMGNCQDIKITDCYLTVNSNSSSMNYIPLIISGSSTSYNTGASNVIDILIENNTIVGGHTGISCCGGSAGDNLQNVRIEHNDILDVYYWGVYVSVASSPVVKNNYINTRSQGVFSLGSNGIYFNNIYGSLEVSYNNIPSNGAYGIYILNSNATVDNPSLIYNNALTGFRNATAGGIYLGSSNYINIYYNSVNMHTTGIANAIYALSTATNLRVLNNSFAYTGSGNGRAAYYAATTSLVQSDYNNYFVGTSTNFIYYGTAISNLNPMRAHGHDLQSKIGDPLYTSDLDLNPAGLQLFASGTPILGIEDDILGNQRNQTTPSIGAYEIEAWLNDLAALSITGPLFGLIETIQSFTIEIFNSGVNTQDNYVVRLMSAEPQEELASLEVTTPLASNATVFHNLNWIPTEAGGYEVFGMVDLISDENSVNDSSYTINFQIMEPIVINSSTPYLEDYESGAGNWMKGINSGINQWEWGTPDQTQINTAYSGDNCWMTSLNQNYDNNADSWLMSPVFDFSALDTPQFSVWLNIWCEEDYDGMILESSIDIGESWQHLIGDESFYNNSSELGPLSPPKWSGNTVGLHGIWTEFITSLPELANEPLVLFRFRFASNNSVQDEGFAVDDLMIWQFSPPELATPVVSAQIFDNNILLSWETVEGANSYKIYSSEDPYTEDWGLPAAIVALPGYSEAIGSKRFFKVVASTDLPPARNIITDSQPPRELIRR